MLEHLIDRQNPLLPVLAQERFPNFWRAREPSYYKSFHGGRMLAGTFHIIKWAEVLFQGYHKVVVAYFLAWC